MITYEFLYGIPPFHAETPEKVFENILSGRIDRDEEYIDFSPEALDFMKHWLNVDSSRRLGANGAAEVKAYPFFNASTRAETQRLEYVCLAAHTAVDKYRDFGEDVGPLLA